MHFNDDDDWDDNDDDDDDDDDENDEACNGFLHAMNEAFEEKLSALKITTGSATQTHGSAATFDFLFISYI